MAGEIFFDLTSSIHPVEERHTNIQQHYVHLVFLYCFDQRSPVANGSDKTLTFVSSQFSDTLHHQRMVIRQQDTCTESWRVGLPRYPKFYVVPFPERI